MSLSIQRNSVIFIILIILFPIINLFGGGILDYYDEVLGVIVFIAVMNWYIQKRLDYSDSLMVNILAVITVIGIISNLFSGAVSNLFIIAVDALWFWKTFALYIYF